jgi:hypothetical protein
MSEMLKTKLDLVTALWKSFSTCIGLNGGQENPCYVKFQYLKNLLST